MNCDILDWSPVESDFTPTKILPIIIDNNDDNEQLLNTELDIQDQEYINRNYRKGGKKDDIMVSCSKCFTPISYQARLGPSGYIAESVINVKYMTGDDKYNFKRDRKPNLILICESCDEVIATQDGCKIYNFTDVIPSNI